MGFAKRCLLILGGFLTALLIVEVLCRCFNLFVPPILLATEDTRQAEIPYSVPHQPFYSVPHQPFFAEENRISAERGIPLKELGYHTKRSLVDGRNGVVMLGDSFTVAEGVHEGEGFADLLQQGRDGFPIVNLGVAGSGLDNMNYQLRSFIHALKPKLVICAIYADDLRRHRPDWLLIRDRPVACLEQGHITYVRAADALRNSFLYHHSRVYQIENYVFRKKREQWASNFLTFGYTYRLNYALLQEMNSTCRRNHAQLMVMFIPSRKSLETNALVWRFTRPRSLYSICGLQHIPLLDLTASVRAKPSAYYLANSTHFNKEGHRLASTQLDQFITQQHLLESGID